MKKLNKLKIGLDWDDVVAPFNSIAIDMANKKYGLDLKLEDIDSWENTGKASVIKEFYSSTELYKRQKPKKETIKLINELMNIADVYFITAVGIDFMTLRAKQILDAFPNLSPDKILIGAAKNLVHFDIVLDDAVHNILESPADYPVLMRKPWNKDMTGLLAVNNIEEFVSLVEQIISNEEPNINSPAVIALVGPSGSGKNNITTTLINSNKDLFERPINYSTNPYSTYHTYLTDNQFLENSFFEKTKYAGYSYGIKKQDIKDILVKNKYAVIPVDMCGAITLKTHFRTIIVYVNVDKEKSIRSIISSDNLDDEKVLRILSLNAERKNRLICDFCIDNNDNKGAERIIKLLLKNS